jgi:quercetin dioxygenase-like cupin family protein
MMARHLVAGTLALAAVAVAAPAALAQQQPPAVKRTELMRVPIAGTEGKEGVVFRADFPPGAVSPRHTHPGQEFLYVLDGTLVIEPDGGPAETVKAGGTSTNPTGRVHTAKNPSATEPTHVLVFLLAEKGQPLATPAK